MAFSAYLINTCLTEYIGSPPIGLWMHPLTNRIHNYFSKLLIARSKRQFTTDSTNHFRSLLPLFDIILGYFQSVTSYRKQFLPGFFLPTLFKWDALINWNDSYALMMHLLPFFSFLTLVHSCQFLHGPFCACEKLR